VAILVRAPESVGERPKGRVVTRAWLVTGSAAVCHPRWPVFVLGEVTAYVLMTSVDLGTSVADALVDSGSMVVAHASSAEVRVSSRSSSGRRGAVDRELA
jgi:hypothetical protein